MGLSFCIFLGLLAYYGIVPSIGIVFVPLLVVWTAIASLGIAYLLSALTVAYRDFKFVIPFMVQIWQFLSPVVYPSSMVPDRYRWLLCAQSAHVGSSTVSDGRCSELPFRGSIWGFQGYRPWCCLRWEWCIFAKPNVASRISRERICRVTA